MKAFLLSAGLGSRMGELTKSVPKCLLPIGGMPLLEIWLKLLEHHRIREVLINTHWLSEKVEQYIYKRKKLDKKNKLKINLTHESNLLGSAGTIWNNKNWIEDGEPFLILYADNLTNVNLTKMWQYHDSHGKEMTIGVFNTDLPKKCGIVNVDKDNTVIKFVEKPENPTTNLAAAGVYLTDKRILKYYAKELDYNKTLDLGFHVLPKMVNKMKAYLLNDILIDIGTPNSYKKARAAYSYMNKEFIN